MLIVPQSGLLAFSYVDHLLGLCLRGSGIGGEAASAVLSILQAYLGGSVGVMVGIATGILTYAIFSSETQTKQWKWERAVIIIGLLETCISVVVLLQRK